MFSKDFMVFNPFFYPVQVFEMSTIAVNIAQDVPINPPSTANIFRENTLDIPFISVVQYSAL